MSGIVERIFPKKKTKESDSFSGKGYEIDGAEESRAPLSTVNISYFFCKKKDIFSVENVSRISEELGVAEEVVIADLRKVCEDMMDNLTCVVEYPYVDEYYRDCYYSFYSRKHNDYNRNCFRMSFFFPEVKEDNYFDVDMEGRYYGYIVLQPTPRCIIGYCFLNPRVYKDHAFSICCCTRDSFVMGRKVTTTAFPYSGQDGEVKSCAETSILCMCDYFSRKYNRYIRILPSQISTMVSDNPLSRQQPTIGIEIENVERILNSNGITTRRYEKVTEEPSKQDNRLLYDDFYRMLGIYVESGFPIYVSTSTHAMLIVGRGNEGITGGRYVCIDDNKRPYSNLVDEKEIQSFIVPHAENILTKAQEIDVDGLLKYFQKLYKDIDLIDTNERYQHRLLLTTSRLYKDYVVHSEMEKDNKIMVVCTAMPKFIWVSESIRENEVRKSMGEACVDTVCILDATEFSHANNRLLMVKTKNKLIVPVQDRLQRKNVSYIVNNSTEKMHPFFNNLKG